MILSYENFLTDMKTKKLDNARLGLFVLAGLLFLVLTLYMIGRNRNLLGSSFILKAMIHNANGLVPGNNVRFKGIDVGTVKSISIASDSEIYISMIIDQKVKPFIKKNAIVSIGSDGLMGNKLVNINSVPGTSEIVKNGDILASLKPIETDEMLRTLNTTNENIEKITSNLYEITVKLNSSNSLWTLLSDTVLTQDLKIAVNEFRIAGSHTVKMTDGAKDIILGFKDGHGLASRLFGDTTLSNQLTSSLEEIRVASIQTSQIVRDLKIVVDHLKQGEGTAGLILSDTTMRHNLEKSMQHIEQGTDRFNQNMEALKSNFLLRRYFRNLEKKSRQDKTGEPSRSIHALQSEK